eukprot:jgi/Botrbrau1/9004/Bobra.0148s0107.1
MGSTHLGVLCGAAASGNFTWTLDNVGKSLVCMIMSGPFLTGYTQTINDYYDREMDAINEPYRPIPSGIFAGNQGPASFSHSLTGVRSPRHERGLDRPRICLASLFDFMNRNQSAETSMVQNLPEDVLERLMCSMGADTAEGTILRPHLALVCKRWQHIIKSPVFWRVIQMNTFDFYSSSELLEALLLCVKNCRSHVPIVRIVQCLPHQNTPKLVYGDGLVLEMFEGEGSGFSAPERELEHWLLSCYEQWGVMPQTAHWANLKWREQSQRFQNALRGKHFRPGDNAKDLLHSALLCMFALGNTIYGMRVPLMLLLGTFCCSGVARGHPLNWLISCMLCLACMAA